MDGHGGMIAQKLALMHQEKVGKLVIYGSLCCGKESVQVSPDISEKIANQTGTSLERRQRFLPLLISQEWREAHPNYQNNLPTSSEVITNKTLNLQTEAIINWPGACNQLDNITQQTLVIVGTDDVLTGPANSLLIAERIPGAWFVQMEGGGQGLVYQYPERFSDLVLTFLATD